MLRQTVNSLLEIMRCENFRNFPDDYMVVDVETTGVRFHKAPEKGYPVGKKPWWDGDLITELGFCHVKDGVSQVSETLVLNWASVKEINRKALIARMEETRQQMEFKNGVHTGRTYSMSIERMESEGVDPLVVLEQFCQIMTEARQQGNFFIGHNGYFFDAKMLESHFGFWCQSNFKFKDNELFDTGMIEKGARSAAVPWSTDTVRDWSLRVYAQRLKGISWALDRTCVPRYGLAEKYNLDMSKAHGAGFDAYVTHCLFEEYKKIASGERVEPPIYVPAT